MQLTLYRKTSNHLYTEGTLAVNGHEIIQTVESTEVMLPEGYYEVQLGKGKSRHRELIFWPMATHPGSDPWSIGLVHSWKDSRKNRRIGIGHPLIPGVLYRGTAPYKRLFERIEKGLQRKELILLVITQEKMVQRRPSRYWTIAHPTSSTRNV